VTKHQRAPATSSHPRPHRGVSAIETLLIFIAAVGAGSLIAFTLLQTSLRSSGEGGAVAQRAVGEAAGALSLKSGVLTTRDSVDIDGDNVINLGGNDRQAVVKVSFIVISTDPGSVIDLTPPYTVNSTGTEPDASGLTNSTLFSISTRDFHTLNAAWSVSFPGSDNGDYLLDPAERAEVTVWLHPYDGLNGHYDVGAGSSDPYVDTTNGLLLANKPLVIEAAVAGGGTMLIERTLPIELSASDHLD
jgi:archaellin